MQMKTSIAPAKPHYDFEIEPLDDSLQERVIQKNPFLYYLRFFIMGTLFGIVLIKGEVVSWFRIQEMFRLHSFHMYGVIGPAVITGIISVWIIKRFHLRTIQNETVIFHKRK